MEHELLTVETCLEIATGFSQDFQYRIKIDPKDRNFLCSVGTQTARGVALTDRQYALVKEKLLKFQGQFQENGLNNLEECLGNLRMPLRSVDRSKTVTVEKTDTDSGSLLWIKVRFPFNKKTIRAMDKIAETLRKDSLYHHYRHDRNSKSHYFSLTEKSVVEVINAVKDKNFEIEGELLDYYEEILKVDRRKEDYLPMFSNGDLLNISTDLRAFIKEECGNDSLKILDRKLRYGIICEEKVQFSNLLGKVLNRPSPSILVDRNKESLETVFETITRLDRFPLVIGIVNDKDVKEQLVQCYNVLKDVVDAKDQSVLFRTTGQSSFNQFVKDKRLNNKVDTNTKVIYISTDKLPKPLIKIRDEWRPCAALMFTSSFVNKFVDTYVDDNCDLILYYDTQMSPLRKHSRLHKW